MSWMQITDHRVMMFGRQGVNIKMLQCPDCNSQEVKHQRPVTHLIIDRSAVLQSACPTTLYS